MDMKLFKIICPMCEECGLEIDRDYNASINILNEGLRILEL